MLAGHYCKIDLFRLIQDPCAPHWGPDHLVTIYFAAILDRVYIILYTFYTVGTSALLLFYWFMIKG